MPFSSVRVLCSLQSGLEPRKEGFLFCIKSSILLCMDIQLRTYEEKDATQVAALMQKFHQLLEGIDPNGRLRTLPGYGEYLLKQVLENTKENGVFYVATDGDTIVGCAGGKILPESSSEDLLGVHPAKKGRFDTIYVDEGYRGKGVGKMLMNQIEQFFKDNGCQLSFLSVFAFNTSVHEMYEHLGYQDVGIDMMKTLE